MSPSPRDPESREIRVALSPHEHQRYCELKEQARNRIDTRELTHGDYLSILLDLYTLHDEHNAHPQLNTLDIPDRPHHSEDQPRNDRGKFSEVAYGD